MMHFSNNPQNLVCRVLPELSWLPWKFKSTQKSKTFWKSVSNQISFLLWLGEQLNYSKHQDWYNLTIPDIEKHGGAALLSQYGNSLTSIVSILFPSHNLYPWLFSSTPRGFWDKQENRLSYFYWLGKELNFTKIEDWYQLRLSHLLERRGHQFMKKYNSSPAQILKSMFPTHSFVPWLFHQTSQKYWKDRNNRRKFCEWSMGSLSFSIPEECYLTKAKNIHDLGGSRVLFYEKRSVFSLFISTLPEFIWRDWSFRTQEENKFKRMMEWMKESYDIQKPEDWYSILTSSGKMGQFKSSKIISYLQESYPTHIWKVSRFFHKKKTQVKWNKLISNIFGNTVEDFPLSKGIELDVFISPNSLAFEVQGEQHYATKKSTFFSDTPFTIRQDETKRRVCETFGISLFTIPFWICKKEDILVPLFQQRPDLQKNT